MKIFRLAWIAGFAFAATPVIGQPLRIVAAENVYGDVAKQIGGAHVEVTSVLSNPEQDPHLFEASPETAKAIAAADIVIANGANYDPWMQKLLAASPSSARKELVVGELVRSKPGDNPHLWYAPDTMMKAAANLASALVAADPANAADYRAGLTAFFASMKGVKVRFGDLRQRFHGVPVAASEPVFGLAAEAIGLDVREQKFALAVMNDAEPAPSDVAGFERDLKEHNVRAVLYNAQASEPAVERLIALAKQNKIPVVGVTETEPPNTRYQDWLMSELDALDRALGTPIN